MNTRWRQAALGLIAMMLVGVAIPRASAQIFMSPTQEKETGQAEHPKILEQYGGIYDKGGLAAYVSQIGQKAAANSEDPGMGYTITLLNSPVVNAFALPGGYVYVTRGLLALANSEAELAGVLGHEVGHVTAHHTAKRYDRAVGTALLGTLLGAVTGSQILGDIANVGGQAYLASFSRTQEYQADALGVKTLAKAGYDPYAQSEFLATLGREETLTTKIAGVAQSRMQFFATHPNTPDRVQKAAEEAKQAGVAPNNNRPRKHDEYLAHIDGMLYGDDPKEGVIRGRTFIHPGLKLSFTVPQGFALQNSSQQVAAISRDGSQIIFDGRKVPAGTDPQSYLVGGFAQEIQLEPENIQRFSVDGLPAASGETEAQTNQGVVYVRMVAIAASSEQIYRFVFVTAPQRSEALSAGFHDTVMSFKRLSGAEADTVTPLRVRVVTAGAGENLQSLAARMGFADYKEERFRVLNAIPDGQGVVAGRRYKIIQ
jgi:predicted Zn-dependent protease